MAGREANRRFCAADDIFLGGEEEARRRGVLVGERVVVRQRGVLVGERVVVQRRVRDVCTHYWAGTLPLPLVGVDTNRCCGGAEVSRFRACCLARVAPIRRLPNATPVRSLSVSEISQGSSSPSSSLVSLGS